VKVTNCIKSKSDEINKQNNKNRGEKHAYVQVGGATVEGEDIRKQRGIKNNVTEK